MGYLLPRAVIVLIAWGTTCLIMNSFTSVDPLVFYVAGGVWAFVGLICFGYLHKLRREEDEGFARAIARARAARTNSTIVRLSRLDAPCPVRHRARRGSSRGCGRRRPQNRWAARSPYLPA